MVFCTVRHKQNSHSKCLYKVDAIKSPLKESTGELSLLEKIQTRYFLVYLTKLIVRIRKKIVLCHEQIYSKQSK